LPWTRFSGFWAALYNAGDVSRAFDAKRFAAIRNHLSSLTVDGEPLLFWNDPTYGNGRACRWRASAKLMSLIVVPEEDTSSLSLLLETTIGFAHPTPTLALHVPTQAPIRPECEQSSAKRRAPGTVRDECSTSASETDAA
jgi:hypothetical protein